MVKRPRKSASYMPTEGATITTEEKVYTLLTRAVRLFYIERDFLSAHVLAGSAREIVQDILRNEGRVTIHTINAEMAKIDKNVAKILTDARSRVYTSLKHWKGEKDTALECYVVRETEAILLETCVEFHRLYQHCYESFIFLEWSVAMNPIELGMHGVDGKTFSGKREVRHDDYDAALAHAADMIHQYDQLNDDMKVDFGHQNVIHFDKLKERGALVNFTISS